MDKDGKLDQHEFAVVCIIKVFTINLAYLNENKMYF